MIVDAQDQDPGMELFMLEAWESLAEIDRCLDRPVDVRSAERAAVFAHRLKGSASLQNLAAIASRASEFELVLSASQQAASEVSPQVVMLDLRTAFESLVRDFGDLMKPSLPPLPVEPKPPSVAPAAPEVPTVAQGSESVTAVRAGAVQMAPSASVPSDSNAVGGDDRAADAASANAGPLVLALQEFFSTQQEALSYFRPEVEELLDEIAAQCAKGDDADVHRLFRACHTLKGSAFIVGCEPLGEVAHLAEEHLAATREDADLRPDLGLVSEVRRLASAMLWMDQRGGSGIDEGVAALRSRLEEDATAAAAETAQELAPKPELLQESSPTRLAEVPKPAATPDASAVASTGSRPASATAVPAAGRPAPRARQMSSGISTLRADVSRIDNIINGLGDIGSQRARLEQSIEALGDIRRQVDLGQRRLARFASSFEQRVEALGSQTESATRPVEGFGEGEFEAEDDFGLLARQIVEISSDLKEVGDSLEVEIGSLRHRYGRLQKVTAGLRSEMGRLRMIPMSRVFARLERTFQSALRPDTPAKFEAIGESAEVDSAVFENVFDALDHVLRNSLAHGIETREERKRLGKPELGTVTVRAVQTRKTVRLEISDDGRGLDLDRVASKALSLGLRTLEQIKELPPERRWELILLPGLSTQETVDNRAGRGVGMDVVANRVRRVGGELKVESTPGSGTTFVFELPLTLVVSDVLVIEAGGSRLALPAGRVQKVLPCNRPAHSTSLGRMMEIDGESLDLAALEGLLGVNRRAPETAGGAMILLRTGRGEQLVEVDRVYGIEEVVLRNLGEFLDPLQHLQGAFLADDGEIVLVLNPDGLGALPEQSARVVAAEGSAQLRVLLADDSVSVRRVIGDQLRALGLEVETAQDGVEALSLMESEEFSMLFTDLEMPNMHGYELIERVRARDRQIPIVVMTTRVSDKHREAASRLGANDVLAKPVTQEQLHEAALLGTRARVS